jgi:hypothetical protein
MFINLPAPITYYSRTHSPLYQRNNFLSLAILFDGEAIIQLTLMRIQILYSGIIHSPVGSLTTPLKQSVRLSAPSIVQSLDSNTFRHKFHSSWNSVAAASGFT